MAELIKKIITAFRKRRDDRFRRRIDRVYFRNSGDGILYMEGKGLYSDTFVSASNKERSRGNQDHP